MTKEQEFTFLENIFKKALEEEEAKRKAFEKKVFNTMKENKRKEDILKKYKTYEYIDEYGTVHTRYTRRKGVEERLQEQLRSEVERPGDLIIKRSNKEVVIPKEFFSKRGTVLPSKRGEYKDLLLLLEEEGA